jgi:hypothetical protein
MEDGRKTESSVDYNAILIVIQGFILTERECLRGAFNKRLFCLLAFFIEIK